MTISVTGCSTCRRVFISSRKASVAGDHELDRAGVDVADLAARRRTAAPVSVSRTASEIVGAGASSSTFWWRRWIEQSRSHEVDARRRGRRRGPAPRRGARARRAARRAACRRRTPRCASRRAAARRRRSSPGARTIRMPLPPPPAAALTMQREADLGGGALGELGRPARRSTAGHDRHAGRDRQPPRLVLAAHALDDVGRRADERQPRLGARPREVRVLGQEAVAGMDRLRAGAPRGVEHGRDRQVRLGAPAPGRCAARRRPRARAARRGRRRSRPRPSRARAARAARSTRIAISPRLATSTRVEASHAEDAVAGRLDRRAGARPPARGRAPGACRAGR